MSIGGPVFTYSVAVNGAREQARQIIQQVFVEELGYTAVGPDDYDENATFLVGFCGDAPIAALRIVPDSGTGLPVEKLVSLGPIRAQGGPIVEVSRLACIASYRNQRVIERATPFLFNVLTEMRAEHVVIESLLELTAFYQRLGFTPFGEPFVDHTVAQSGNGLPAPNAVAMHLKLARRPHA